MSTRTFFPYRAARLAAAVAFLLLVASHAAKASGQGDSLLTVVVPEPSAWLAFLFGGGILLIFRRSRQRPPRY